MFILVQSRDGKKEQMACLTSESMIDQLFSSLDDNYVVTIWRD